MRSPETYIPKTTQLHKIVPGVYEAESASSNEHDFSPTRWEVMSRCVEEGLLNSRAYSRTLFDLSPIGLALVKTDGTIVDRNRAYAAITGRTRGKRSI
jgi:PAS domain-containing protein